LKCLQEKIRKILKDISIGKNFLNRTAIAQEIIAKDHKWDCTKLKSFCTFKAAITRMKRTLQNGRKYLQAIQWTKD
jgi:hypothetical protein